MLVDLLTRFVEAKMTELIKELVKVFACRVRILENIYVTDIALYQSN